LNLRQVPRKNKLSAERGKDSGTVTDAGKAAVHWGIEAACRASWPAREHKFTTKLLMHCG
jgi:hypothetical protein